MVTSRFGSTCGVLLSLLIASTAVAQSTDRPTPPPPAPGQVKAPALEGPTTNLEPIPPGRPEADRSSARTAPIDSNSNNVDNNNVVVTRHDALQSTGARSVVKTRVYAPKEPPAVIAERPTGARPQRRSIWVPGYWDWDPVQAEYFWIGGVWQTPPAGTVWVGSRWTRDDRGWYRKMGFWSKQRGGGIVETGYQEVAPPAWRMTGPPADHPADQPGPAPSPNDFYVPGHYAPDGDQVRWKPGFWTSSQPGWDWIPARWVRRPSGWEFRAGHWVREPGVSRSASPSDLEPSTATISRPPNKPCPRSLPRPKMSAT